MPGDHPEILTRREAAAMVRLSERTLLRLEAEGRGVRPVRLSVRRIGYRLTDLRAWLAARAGREAA